MRVGPVILRKERSVVNGWRRAGSDVPMHRTSVDVEEGTYAVFALQGTLESMRSEYDRMQQEWMPKTKYKAVNDPIEVYDERFLGPEHPESGMEVWLPVAYTHPPHCGSYNNSWTTAAQAVREAIKFTGKKGLSLVDVMGYTGHAFRINIHEGNVDVAGPTGWDWGSVLQKGLLNLGFRSSYAGEPNHTPPMPELLERAIGMIQRSVDRGVPAVAWDLFIPEFGVIFGYDDEKMELHAKDVSREGTLPYQKLGRGQASELFVLTLDEEFEVDRRTALVGALKMIVEHARIRYHRHAEPPYQNGLAGYDAWIHAFRQGKVDLFGNAYNTALVCDSRAYAVQFLLKLQQEWSGVSAAEQEESRLAGEAAGHYQSVFDALVQLPSLYPFPQGGNPNEPANAEFSIHMLQNAKAAEERGIEALERMLDVLER